MENSNIKVLILGHKGMLGHFVYKRLKSFSFNVELINHRWPLNGFMEALKRSDSDFLINCIGSIPQKKSNNYYSNFMLPKDLTSYYKGHIIHPSSDCEISNFTDPYATSKKAGTSIIKQHHKSTTIRSSIIGPEEKTSYGLWSWFENNKNKNINGYTNHLWNGVTSLEWANICVEIIHQKFKNKVIIAGCENISKFNILTYLNKHLKLNKEIIPTSHNISINRLLDINTVRPNIEMQILDLIKQRKLYQVF